MCGGTEFVYADANKKVYLITAEEPASNVPCSPVKCQTKQLTESTLLSESCAIINYTAVFSSLMQRNRRIFLEVKLCLELGTLYIKMYYSLLS